MYALTSYSSQAQTTDIALVLVDVDQPNTLVNTRMGYVALSRARDDAQIFYQRLDLAPEVSQPDPRQGIGAQPGTNHRPRPRLRRLKGLSMNATLETTASLPRATPRKIDLILPHILALKKYVEDPTVTEIMVNRGGREVYIERAGRIERVPETLDPRGLQFAITKIARFCQNEADPNHPIVEARLEDDGSRVAAMMAPCSIDGPTLTIRKFGRRYRLDELVATGSVPDVVARILRDAVARRCNILISGSTGSGKTSLLNATANLIPTDHRILVIEDTSEIAIDDTHHVGEPNGPEASKSFRPCVIRMIAALSFRPVLMTSRT